MGTSSVAGQSWVTPPSGGPFHTWLCRQECGTSRERVYIGVGREAGKEEEGLATSVLKLFVYLKNFRNTKFPKVYRSRVT